MSAAEEPNHEVEIPANEAVLPVVDEDEIATLGPKPIGFRCQN